MLLQARPAQSSVMWFPTGPGVCSSSWCAGEEQWITRMRGRCTEKDNTGVPCFVWLRMKKTCLTEYIQPCTQSFNGYGKPYLKKETMKHCGRTLVLLNIMLNPIFVVVVFVDCFLKYSCAVRPLICFGLYMCDILKWWYTFLLSQKYPNTSEAT